MQSYHYTAIVTLLTALAFFWMATQVARTHVKVGILPPQMTGHPDLDQAVHGGAKSIVTTSLISPLPENLDRL